MATSSAGGGDRRDSTSTDGVYECHICFEQAKDAVVSMCGHLFCWPCIHRWMESRPNNSTCPVCKSLLDKSKLIPLYGRGSNNQQDPREKVPPRPQGQREEAQEAEQGFGMEGINVSFGIGAFPFTMLGAPIFTAFGQQQMPQRPRRGGANPPQRGEEQKVARVFITVALLVLVLIIFS